MDTISRAKRSRVMSLIKPRDTKLEQKFRAALWAIGIRYRKNVKMYGTPDIVIRRAKLLIFLDSCFWHGCRYHCRRPKSNVVFWNGKIERNRQRDLAVTRFYRRNGWIVLRIWEHKLAKDFEACLDTVAASVFDK
jgi:DNA mismatch endonuclease (patch repair protein)